MAYIISVQVNKKFRKFERKYRDCIKETRLGHRHVMVYRRNVMGTLIIITFPKFFIYLSPVIFFLDLGTLMHCTLVKLNYLYR